MGNPRGGYEDEEQWEDKGYLTNELIGYTKSRMTKFTVIIPTRDRPRSLLRCIRSLALQTYKEFDVIILNNGFLPNDLVPPEIGKKLNIIIKTNRSRNLARLYNDGWKLAKSDLIAYLDDDVEVTPRWASFVIEAFQKHPEVAAVGGPTVATRVQRAHQIYKLTKRSSVVSLAFKLYNTIILRGNFLKIGYLNQWGGLGIGGSLLKSTQLEEPIYVDALSTANMVIRRTVLEELGGFDEAFQYQHIDGDLFIRMRRQGLKLLFDPHVVVFHHVDPAGAHRSNYFLAKDFLVFWSKHCKTVAERIMAFLNFMFISSYMFYQACVYRDLNKFKGWLKGALDGIRVTIYLKSVSSTSPRNVCNVKDRISLS